MNFNIVILQNNNILIQNKVLYIKQQYNEKRHQIVS